jgi:PHP family Zn ribbon phosphoesterase
MPTVVHPALVLAVPLLAGVLLLVVRPRLAGLRYAYREVEAAVRSVLGLPPALGSVSAIRCPRCGRWVKPRRFDLRRMSCRSCVSTLGRGRPGRGGDLCL